jgi:hypothetical protein
MAWYHLRCTWLTWRLGCALHKLLFFLLKAAASEVGLLGACQTGALSAREQRGD